MTIILHPWFKGTGLLKLTYIIFVSPTIPATADCVDGSTVKAAYEMAAGWDIFKVALFVWSMFPPAESWVRIPKPVTNAVERGLRKPVTWNVTAVPPLMS